MPVCIGTGLGIANLVDSELCNLCFSLRFFTDDHTELFSETTLGRLLRAVELYILIVHSLITSFSFSAISPHSSPVGGGPGPPLEDYAVNMADVS